MYGRSLGGDEGTMVDGGIGKRQACDPVWFVVCTSAYELLL